MAHIKCPKKMPEKKLFKINENLSRVDIVRLELGQIMEDSAQYAASESILLTRTCPEIKITMTAMMGVFRLSFFILGKLGLIMNNIVKKLHTPLNAKTCPRPIRLFEVYINIERSWPLDDSTTAYSRYGATAIAFQVETPRFIHYITNIEDILLRQEATLLNHSTLPRAQSTCFHLWRNSKGQQPTSMRRTMSTEIRSDSVHASCRMNCYEMLSCISWLVKKLHMITTNNQPF